MSARVGVVGTGLAPLQDKIIYICRLAYPGRPLHMPAATPKTKSRRPNARAPTDVTGSNAWMQLGVEHIWHATLCR